MSKQFHVHLVSDATGETLNAIARAALAQFEGVVVNEHFYALVPDGQDLSWVQTMTFSPDGRTLCLVDYYKVRLYDTGTAIATQERLAHAKIWSRIFGDRPGWLRLGLPGVETEWMRLAAALSAS